jgi:hypothetical protein
MPILNQSLYRQPGTYSAQSAMPSLNEWGCPDLPGCGAKTPVQLDHLESGGKSICPSKAAMTEIVLSGPESDGWAALPYTAMQPKFRESRVSLPGYILARLTALVPTDTALYRFDIVGGLFTVPHDSGWLSSGHAQSLFVHAGMARSRATVAKSGNDLTGSPAANWRAI